MGQEQKNINFEQLGEKIIILVKKVCKNFVAFPLINELFRSSTSVGANYMEANGMSSKKDFKNKIHICKKEAKETMRWLRMLAIADENIKDECRALWQEMYGYAKMFSKIISTTSDNKN